MGSSIATTISSSMGDTMKNTMAENQKSMMDAQLQMAMKRREMMMAVNMSRARDIFRFYSSFTATVFCLGLVGAIKLKNPGPLLPSIPLGWICAFQYDLAYGNKLQRVRNEAGQILDEKWRLGNENPFNPPENNLLIEQMTYDALMKRE
eukprot:204233_1